MFSVSEGMPLKSSFLSSLLQNHHQNSIISCRWFGPLSKNSNFDHINNHHQKPYLTIEAERWACAALGLAKCDFDWDLKAPLQYTTQYGSAKLIFKCNLTSSIQVHYSWIWNFTPSLPREKTFHNSSHQNLHPAKITERFSPQHSHATANQFISLFFV